MTPERRDDISLLLAMLTLPISCGNDDSSGEITSLSETAGTTEPSSSATGDTSTGSGVGTTLTTSTDSDAMTSSSDGVTLTTGSQDSTSGTGDGGGTTGGEVGPVCQAYAAKLGECFPDRVEIEETAAACQEVLDTYAGYGEDCFHAIEGLFICRSEADCRELKGGDPCSQYDAMVESFC